MNIEDFTKILQENNKNAEILNEIHKATLNIKDEKIRELEQEIERLNNIINNAIEFINGGKGWKKLNLTHQEKMLLGILKDSDKE